MSKTVKFIIFFLLCCTFISAETKVIPMPDLMKPGNIYFDESRMYITENASVYIYSTKDYKLIKKFGQKGEGPGEFLLNSNLPGLFVSKQGKEIMVQSFGRVAWFDAEGEFKREVKTISPYMLYVQSLGDNIVGRQLTGGKERWLVINIYDKEFKLLKEIHRVKHVYQPGKGTNAMALLPPSVVYDNKLYIVPDDSFTISVYDQKGELLTNLKLDEKKRPMTEKDKQEVLDFFKTSILTKDSFHLMKPFHFPEYFPAIKGIAVGQGNIFVVTNSKNEKGEQACLVLDMKGKIINRPYVTMTNTELLQLSPFAINDNAVYQLVENEEKEEYTLNITKIK